MAKSWFINECPVCQKPMDTFKRSASGDLATCSVKCGYKWREIKRKQTHKFVKPDSPIDRFIL